MFSFDIDPAASKAELYAELLTAAQALTQNERDPIANMANVAALIWQDLPGLNWAGFYRLVDDELVLGPFQGKPACIRIPMGQGVCGTAAQNRETLCVVDVHSFPGHIACDAQSRSEIVVPVVHARQFIGVLDLDSPVPARFDEEDVAGLERLVGNLAFALSG